MPHVQAIITIRNKGDVVHVARQVMAQYQRHGQAADNPLRDSLRF
jgi:hypothetical protein